MINFKDFRETIEYHEDIADISEQYEIDSKMAMHVKDQLVEKNIKREDTDAVVRIIKIREEETKKTISEKKQENLNHLLNEFKKDKVKRQNINERFQSIFK